MAYLRTTAEKQPKPRAEMLKANPDVMKMPKILGCEHLLGYLNDMGISLHGAMGKIPLSFQEIEAYIRVKRLKLSLWEIQTLKDMSNSYTSETYNRDVDATAPYGNATISLDSLDKAMENARIKSQKKSS